MAIHYTRAGGGDLGGTAFFEMARDLQGIIEEELADAGADGVLEGQKIIESSGTGRSWNGSFRDRDGSIRSGSGSGRVHTGKMLRAVDFRVLRGKESGLDVGWIHPADWEEYFAAQDQGFEAGGYRPSQFVAGMGMIAHLRFYMRVTTDEAIDRALRRISDGL